MGEAYYIYVVPKDYFYVPEVSELIKFLKYLNAYALIRTDKNTQYSLRDCINIPHDLPIWMSAVYLIKTRDFTEFINYVTSFFNKITTKGTLRHKLICGNVSGGLKDALKCLEEQGYIHVTESDIVVINLYNPPESMNYCEPEPSRRKICFFIELYCIYPEETVMEIINTLYSFDEMRNFLRDMKDIFDVEFEIIGKWEGG